jgi:hypothetical protein
MICSNCSALRIPGMRFCPLCGVRLPTPQSPKRSIRSQLGRGVLFAFMGLAGIFVSLILIGLFTRVGSTRTPMADGQYREFPPPASDSASAVKSLNRWWKEFTYSPPPQRVGTVTPSRTITTASGRVYALHSHVQTSQEFQEQSADVRFTEHQRSLVTGFRVSGRTGTVVTILNRANVREARGLCHNLGAFVSGNQNEIVGSAGELLWFRRGLKGAVR